MNDAILVTDGEHRSALAAVRALGRAGYRVVVCSSRRRSLAGASRFADAREMVPSPLDDPSSFAGAVEDAVHRHDVRVLLPMTDESVRAMLPARDRFAGVCIPLPDAETVRRVSDKALVLGAAQRLGIAVPGQQIVTGPEWEGPEAGSLRLPVVLKPSSSVTDVAGRQRKLQVSYAASEAEVRTRLASYPTSAYPILLQSRVVGPGVGVFLLLWKGDLLASFSHRRIREKPPAGGVSVYCESIPADVELVAQSRRLLESFEWSGVAMVEYKVDQATGTPHLMEVNGRFWGSLQLAIDAGVNFPLLLVQAAAGHEPQPVSSYRVGVRSRWWWGDVDHLIARLRRSPADLALPAGAPSRTAALWDFLKVWRPGDRNEVLRWGDLGPIARETWDWFHGR